MKKKRLSSKMLQLKTFLLRISDQFKQFYRGIQRKYIADILFSTYLTINYHKTDKYTHIRIEIISYKSMKHVKSKSTKNNS